MCGAAYIGVSDCSLCVDRASVVDLSVFFTSCLNGRSFSRYLSSLICCGSINIIPALSSCENSNELRKNSCSTRVYNFSFTILCIVNYFIETLSMC